MPASLHERHNNVWDGVIFRNMSWTLIASSRGLNPAIIGRDVPTIFNGTHDLEYQQAYIVLVTGDRTGDIRFYSKVFLDSLMPHTLCKAANEVVFKNSNITLNIHDALEAPGVIYMEPERLFSFQEITYALLTYSYTTVKAQFGALTQTTSLELVERRQTSRVSLLFVA